MRLDAHQHFWKYNEKDYPWIKPESNIRKDFLPLDLQPFLTARGIEGTIAVQARQNLDETRWLLELARQFPSIRAVVGWVDLRSERVSEQLAEFAGDQKFAGVRHVVQDEPDDAFMLRPDFLRGISRLKDFDLTYDLLVYPRQLPAAIAMVRQFPEQSFVLDHIAKPPIKDNALSHWRELIYELANYPNVMCKVSGMVTEARAGSWKNSDFQPFLDVVFNAFGSDRLMFGSDWPVCLLAATYQQVFGIINDYVSAHHPSAAEAIMGGNARTFYLRDKKLST